MFITEEQLRERLRSPKNLANRFKNGQLVDLEREEVREIEGINYATEEIPQAEIDEAKNEILEGKNEYAQELSKEGIQHREIKRPGNNRPWLSKQERTRIAADVALSTGYVNEAGQKITQTDIARQYGVQVSTVSDIVNNARRIEGGSRSVDQRAIDAALDKVREAAIDRLMSGLGHLTDDKISEHNGKDISAIAANMAKVVQQTIPQEKAGTAINLIVYTPELRAEKNFDSVEV